MVVKVVAVAATPCMQWSHSQPSVPHSPCPTTLKRAINDVVSISRTPFLQTTSPKLSRSRSVEFHPKQRVSSTIRRAYSTANFDNFSGDDFSREIGELAFRLQNSDASDSSGHEDPSPESRWPENQPEPLDFSASIEMRANRVDLPVSLRMIKLKQKQLKEELIEAGESAYCSVKKAFSSMVFIIRELHSFTLKMRELLFFEDMQGILERVKGEIHASFVWLFQQVFSHTPTLMMYVMILLANFTVHSISTSSALAAVSANPPPAIVEQRDIRPSRTFDSSTTCSTSSSSKTTSVGGGNNGGGKLRPAASGTDGDGWINRTANLHRPILPESVSPLTASEETEKEEMELWNSVVEEASRMQREAGRDEALLDRETVMNLVSPVTAEVDRDEVIEDYSRTEVMYQTALAQEPDNVLLLANYAQFLYLVVRDYDRAEEYFKRATNVEPKDAEAHSKYAHFLWQVRNDLWGAEETFLEAISADPSNSFYAANYAHFLWSTGGEDTCFPLDDESMDG